MNVHRLPRRPLGARRRLLVKEISAFAVVGGACTASTWGVFQLLYAHAGVEAVIARLVSTAISMTVGYFGHRHWSFAHRGRTGLKREYLLFAVVNGLTFLLSLGIVAFVRYPLGQHDALALQAANVASIGIATVLRYLSYRTWIFVAPNHPLAHQDRSRAPGSLPHAA